MLLSAPCGAFYKETQKEEDNDRTNDPCGSLQTQNILWFLWLRIDLRKQPHSIFAQSQSHSGVHPSRLQIQLCCEVCCTDTAWGWDSRVRNFRASQSAPHGNHILSNTVAPKRAASLRGRKAHRWANNILSINIPEQCNAPGSRTHLQAPNGHQNNTWKGLQRPQLAVTAAARPPPHLTSWAPASGAARQPAARLSWSSRSGWGPGKMRRRRRCLRRAASPGPGVAAAAVGRRRPAGPRQRPARPAWPRRGACGAPPATGPPRSAHRHSTARGGRPASGCASAAVCRARGFPSRRCFAFLFLRT